MTAAIVTCRRCAATTSAPPPTDWAVITVSGAPIVNSVACPDCATAVRRLLATPPEEAERRRDFEREAAFAAGFDAGLAEPRDSDGSYLRSVTA